MRNNLQKADVRKAVRSARDIDGFLNLVSTSGKPSSSRSDHKALEAVLLDVAGSSDGFSTVALHRVTNDAIHSTATLAIDAFTIWHLQVFVTIVHGLRSFTGFQGVMYRTWQLRPQIVLKGLALQQAVSSEISLE